jgi:hypothetical protein
MDSRAVTAVLAFNAGSPIRGHALHPNTSARAQNTDTHAIVDTLDGGNPCNAIGSANDTRPSLARDGGEVMA